MKPVATPEAVRRTSFEKPRIEIIRFNLIDFDPKQPRQIFGQEELDELATSLLDRGLLQFPIVVDLKNGRFKMVAGERRVRALQKLGESEGYFSIREDDPKDAFVLSLIENIQRVNLNPVEEAQALKRLHDEFGMSWQDIADLIRKSVATVANRIKLLSLPEEIQDMIREGRLPQVGALSLAQYKGNADLIRMAHDLIAGKDPIEHPTRDGRKYETSPEGLLFKQILQLAWGTKAGTSAVELLFSYLPGTRERLWGSLAPIPQANFLEQIRVLRGTCDRILEAFVVTPLPAETSLPEPKPSIKPPARPVSLARQGDLTKAPTVPPSRSGVPLAPSPTLPGMVPSARPKTQARDWPKLPMDDVLRKAKAALEVVISPTDNADKARRHYLSIERIKREGFTEADVGEAFRLLRDNWGRPPNTDIRYKDEFLVFLAGIRNRSQRKTYQEFRERFLEIDESKDAITLPK